jgi:poly [ADP-ribose] polymerase
LVEKDYDDTTKNNPDIKKELEDENEESTGKKLPPSNLDEKVQNLIELICNVTEMEKALKEMKYDSQKAPLGKLSKNQIKAG